MVFNEVFVVVPTSLENRSLIEWRAGLLDLLLKLEHARDQVSDSFGFYSGQQAKLRLSISCEPVVGRR